MSAIMPTLMVVAVIPMSLAGTVPVGEADAELDADAEALDDADAEADAEAEAEAGELLVLEEELHPAASRTAATAATATPAKRARLGIRRPEPPRPGLSLIRLIPVPPRLHCL
jgi:pyruvate/2-oxoglutarate dehydrogenase complex dihydrolipoamide acyltransferase (E2) component